MQSPIYVRVDDAGRGIMRWRDLTIVSCGDYVCSDLVNAAVVSLTKEEREKMDQNIPLKFPLVYREGIGMVRVIDINDIKEARRAPERAAEAV